LTQHSYRSILLFVFHFTQTATTAIYPLSLHDALPIYPGGLVLARLLAREGPQARVPVGLRQGLRARRLAGRDHSRGIRRLRAGRSEEHTSELQSRGHLVCRLLLEKKNTAL